MTITLSRTQIEKLIQIYEHFSDIPSFTISLESDSDMINVAFEMSSIPEKQKAIVRTEKPFKAQSFK